MASSLCDTMEQVLCCMYCLDSKMVTLSSPLFEHLNYSLQRIILCRDQAVSLLLQTKWFQSTFSLKVKGANAISRGY